MTSSGEYDDKDVTAGRTDRAGAKPAQEGEYDDKNVADDAERSDAPEGSFVDKDVEPRAPTAPGQGEYDDKDVNRRPPAS
jgi:hypothetical protein